MWMCVWMDFVPNPNLKHWIQHQAIEINFFYWSSHFWCHSPCHSQHYPIYTTNRCNGYGSKKDLKMEVWYSKITKLGGTKNDPWFLQSSHSSGSPELGKSQRTASASPVQHSVGISYGSNLSQPPRAGSDFFHNPTTLSDSTETHLQIGDLSVHCPIAPLPNNVWIHVFYAWLGARYVKKNMFSL